MNIIQKMILNQVISEDNANNMLADIKDFKEKNPKEYDAVISLADKTIAKLKQGNFNPDDYQYEKLGKEEALIISAGLIRQSRKEQGDRKEAFKNFITIVGFLLRSIFMSAMK